ncbi:50S ribosomal protein L19 [Blattabacterium cuenoti]|uniref:50S ribosomal protein L19 n=1 Tax=Blattabacterium cuenoti TaxID=1653831 RepID=UPI00163D2400|nr:50S ribosomal protein L19 [Blattabacterium cuenoti]
MSINFYIKHLFQQNIIKKIPYFNSGYTITVFFEIKEGHKIRLQNFKGIVIKKQGKGYTKTFTVRKISGSIGIERIFYVFQPNIKEIQIHQKGKVRRSKIYYMRSRKGKKIKIISNNIKKK